MPVIHMLDIDTDPFAQAILYDIRAVRMLGQVGGGQIACAQLLYISYGILKNDPIRKPIIHLPRRGMQHHGSPIGGQHDAIRILL